MLLAALSLELVHAAASGFDFPLPGKVRALELLLILLATITAAVALLFNRFQQGGVSEKYPAIVQDTLVIGMAAVAATYWWPERLLTTSALGVAVIGFALQDTLGNLFSGLAIQIEKPFHVGDWIRSGEHEGQVQEMTWRATKVRTKAGNFVVIPNAMISKDKIVNYSQPTHLLRLEVVVGLGYDHPPNKVKQVALAAMAEVPEIFRDPPPDVLIGRYGDFSLEYRCRFWVDDYAQSEPITDKFTTLLYYNIERAGMTIPFPIHDVRITEKRPAPLEETENLRRRLVDGVDLFQALAPTDRQWIAEALQPETFADGETVIRQGIPGDSMFFIQSGRVRVVLERGGEYSQIAALAVGEYFGEMSLLTGEPRAATVIADGDVKTLVLHKEAFRKILLHDSAIATELSRIMVSRKQLLEAHGNSMGEDAATIVAVQESFLNRIRRFFGL